jgi:hypothetical protein
MAKTLPRLPRLRLLALSNAEAKRFSCALIGLKGELAARMLRRLADEGPVLAKRLFDPGRSALDVLESARRHDTRLLEVRASRADLRRYSAILAKVLDVPPAPGDEMALQ